MEAHVELRDATRGIIVRWLYNSGSAMVSNLGTGEYIGTLAVLLPANPTIQTFRGYVDAAVDALLEAKGEKD